MTDVLDPRCRPADCPTRLTLPIPPKDQPIYRYGTTLVGDRLVLTSGAATGDRVVLQFDEVLAAGSSVVIDVLEGWTIKPIPPPPSSQPGTGTWIQKGNLWTHSYSAQALGPVVEDNLSIWLYFLFVQQSSGRSHDPVVIVERPPSVEEQPSPSP